MRPIRSYKCDIFSGDETKEYLPVASHFEAFTNICYYNTFFHLTHRVRGINENSIIACYGASFSSEMTDLCYDVMSQSQQLSMLLTSKISFIAI